MPTWVGAALGLLAKLYELAKLGLAYFAGRRAAQDDMEDETDRMVGRADDVARKVDDMTDDEVRRELEDKWSRNS